RSVVSVHRKASWYGIPACGSPTTSRARRGEPSVAVVGVARSLRLVAGYERYVANGDRRRGRRAPLPCPLETRRIDRAQAAGGLAPRQPAAEKPAKGAA